MIIRGEGMLNCKQVIFVNVYQLKELTLHLHSICMYRYLQHIPAINVPYYALYRHLPT